MEKLNDNFLLSAWNGCINKNVSKYNSIFEKYLSKTNAFDIQGGVIVSSREIDKHAYISIVYKKIIENDISHTIYSFVIFDVSPSLPPENSRIQKYCVIHTELFDILETIINYKLSSITNAINKSIDEKFNYFFNKNFKSIKYKLGNRQLVDILIKPENLPPVPSMSEIISSGPAVRQKSKSPTPPPPSQMKEVEIQTEPLSGPRHSETAENKKTCSVIPTNVSENIFTDDLDQILMSFELSRISEFEPSQAEIII
jgi:hypothetical protein